MPPRATTCPSKYLGVEATGVVSGFAPSLPTSGICTARRANIRGGDDGIGIGIAHTSTFTSVSTVSTGSTGSLGSMDSTVSMSVGSGLEGLGIEYETVLSPTWLVSEGALWLVWCIGKMV